MNILSLPRFALTMSLVCTLIAAPRDSQAAAKAAIAPRLVIDLIAMNSSDNDAVITQDFLAQAFREGLHSAGVTLGPGKTSARYVHLSVQILYKERLEDLRVISSLLALRDVATASGGKDWRDVALCELNLNHWSSGPSVNAHISPIRESIVNEAAEFATRCLK